MNIFQTKFIAETGISIPFDKHRAVCITGQNGYVLFEDSLFCEVNQILLFPNREYAKYFVANQHKSKGDYRDCMYKSNYTVFLIQLRNKQPNDFKEETYIDDFHMCENYQTTKPYFGEGNIESCFEEEYYKDLEDYDDLPF